MLSFVHRLLNIPYTMYVRTDRHAEGKTRATVVFVHGIGNTGKTWEPIIDGLPKDMRLIAVDLLGFGKSRKPDWLRYDVAMQARSLQTTLYKLRITGPVIIVGHSLGSLIAIEFAKRYPRRVASLVLCSPPLYDYSDASKKSLRLKADDVLRDFYLRVGKGNKARLVKLAAMAMKYKLISPAFSVTDENINSYMATLSASIVQQTSLVDAESLHLPISIIRGKLDPVVLLPNIKKLQKINPQVKLTQIAAGHEVTGRFIPATTEAILDVSLKS